MHVKLYPFRSSPAEVFFREDAARNEINPQENTNTEAWSQQSRFATLLKSHPCSDTPPEIPSTSAEQPPRENTSGGLILHVKRILKVWYYEKILFTVVKRNSLAVKMYNNNNNNNSNNNNNNNNNNNKSNKYPVIVSRSRKNALRFFHWALLLWH